MSPVHALLYRADILVDDFTGRLLHREMNNESFIRGQLALLGWREGQDHGLQAMLAIANMVVNRHRAGWGSLLDCIGDYSAFSAHGTVKGKGFPNLTDPAFRKLLMKIDDIASGTAPDTLTVAPPDPSTGAPGRRGLYCAELNRVDRPWFLENICRRPEEHPRTAAVAGLTFFG